MASYDLTCRSCNASFEVFSTGFLKDDQKVCPECGSTNVQQQFTGFFCGTSSSSSAASGSCAAPAGCGFG